MRRLPVHMKVSAALSSFLLHGPCKGKACANLVQFVCTHALAQCKEICKELGCSTAGYTWHRQELRAEKTMVNHRKLLAMIFML